MNLKILWLKLKEIVLPTRTLRVLNSDELPSCLPRRDLVLCSQHGEEWCIGMRCPCGCKQRIELPLLEGVRPRWQLNFEKRGKPTLNPSIWLREGCCSHFFVRSGKIIWV